MRRDWPSAAASYEETVTKALRAVRGAPPGGTVGGAPGGALGAALGGVDLARAVEGDPGLRSALVRPALDQLGLLDLDPWADEEESAAAVLGVRAAGAVVLPWPVTHRLAVPPRLRDAVDGAFLVPGATRRLDHADLFRTAVAVDLTGARTHRVTARGPHPAPLDPFGVDVELAPTTLAADAPAVVAMHLLLDAFWVSGALTSAATLAVDHARERQQFGRAIGTFGEIRWRLADIAVAVDGLSELALHAWWLLRRAAATPADLLALRLQTLEAADVVLANAHQVLGAMGLCDEHDLSVIDRHLQPVLHRPAGRIVTTDLLARAVARDGFAATYPVPPLPAP